MTGTPVVLEPPALGVPGVTKLRLCWTRWELVAALLAPDLDAPRGLPVQPCTVRPRGFSLNNDYSDLRTSAIPSTTGFADRLFLTSALEERALSRESLSPFAVPLRQRVCVDRRPIAAEHTWKLHPFRFESICECTRHTQDSAELCAAPT